MGDRIDVDARIYPGNSFTSKNGKYTLILQEDSNFVLYKRNDDGSQTPLWNSDTWEGDGTSTNKSIILQADGNFVMYNAGGQPLWSSNTGGYQGMSKPYILVQDDGNVCLYDEGLEGQCLWNTDTYQG